VSSTKIRICTNIATKQPETLLYMHTQTTWPYALLVHKRNICSISRQKWLSVFCTFSGLTIHPGKIKATIVGKIDAKHELKTKPDEMEYCLSTLTVFDHQREPIECPIDPILAIYKYLGVHLELRYKNNDAFERKKAKAAAILLHLLTQASSPQPKINYI
jgi:hypothetical protein